MIYHKEQVFAKRIAENIARYDLKERKVILARYGEGSYLIQTELKEIQKKDRKWLST